MEIRGLDILSERGQLRGCEAVTKLSELPFIERLRSRLGRGKSTISWRFPKKLSFSMR